MARELRAHPDKQRCESRANLSCWLWRCNVAFPRNRFAYQIISDRDHERAIEAVNRHTSQGWRARQMCVDPRDGSLVVLLELRFDLRGKQRLSNLLADAEPTPSAMPWH